MNFQLPFGQRIMRRGAGSLLLSLSLLACTEKAKTFVPPTPAPIPPAAAVKNEEAKDYAQYTEQVWSDEFEGGALDQTKWTYDLGGGGWGNQELETYTNSTDNVYLSGGNLVIKAIKQAGSNAYTSGRILTKGKKDFQYGRIDVRARIPKGKGIWPAIWMLGSDVDQNSWPLCGEIDIMEERGSLPQEFLSTMHYGNSFADHRYKGTTKVVGLDLSADFHIWSVVRSKDQMRFFFDGEQYYSFSASDASPYPFNNNFFVILNVAVGGNFGGDPDASTTFPQQMQVDYVKYLQYK